jgi:hypothetical protein
MSFTDNKLVPLNLASGEMVDITPANQVSRREREASNIVNLTVQGESVSRDQMRDMFEKINSGIRDGYRINLEAA